MRYHALACDYDGTLALHGRVADETLASLEKLLATGRRLLLVTGRELEDLQEIFPHLGLFARVVAENGAILHDPGGRETRVLSKPPPENLVRVLRDRGVAPLSVGHVIIATWHPHEATLLEAIRDLGLEMQVIFNKDAVMALPSGVNKATGLSAALHELGLSPHEVVGIGDAENDHAFLAMCECAVAVSNALPAVKKAADLVTLGDHGAGVKELIEELVDTDLSARESRLTRHHLLLGTQADGSQVHLSAYGQGVLIAGPSGSGKSTAAAGLLERLNEHRYQFCLIDPEGDYESFPGSVAIGSAQRAPTTEEVLQLLTTSQESAVANLVGLPVSERPSFFLGLLPRLLELRARTGRPHWLIVDEAHHLLPASWQPGPQVLPNDLKRTLFVTVHPGQVAPDALASVDVVLAVGPEPEQTLQQLCTALGETPPRLTDLIPEPGQVVCWSRQEPEEAFCVRLVPSRAERRRHTRKYAEGELPPDRSFYFRGPDDKLNLRCQNLFLFLQTGHGVDEETWMHHLREGDYSRWFREHIKDEMLADETEQIEQRKELTAETSRALIREAVERYYTLPAGPPLPMPGTDAATARGKQGGT